MPPDEHSPNNKRSRSAQRGKDSSHDVKRRRSRSPHRRRHKSADRPAKANLPFGSRNLHKHDLDTHRALFAHYLDLQKQLEIGRLSEDEVKGRWKSFLGKWNRGELAEGWYDPETKKRTDERAARAETTPSLGSEDRHFSRPTNPPREPEEDDTYGPAPPETARTKSGPTVPSIQDLQHRRELDDEDRQAARAELRYERQQDRGIQRNRLEELAPRADPGSRERQLEKKRDAAASNKVFKEAKEAGAEEVGDGDLMGDDGIEGYKARRKQIERQKNERELRKEEVLRARAAEREERMLQYRTKEDKTMQMLRELAQQRFGGQT